MSTPERTCVFCEIVEGQGGVTERIDEGAHHIVFVPLGPHVPGHVLFVPTRHIDHAADDPDEAARTFAAAAAYVRDNSLDANIITSVGKAATQSVFHLHIHVIPRGPSDHVVPRWPWIGQTDHPETPALPVPVALEDPR